jgi:hypothetical protein
MLALACALLTVTPGLASAASTGVSQALSDCNSHGRLTGHYSPDVLRQALAQMPADMREYTDCFDVMQRQLLAELGSTGSGGGGLGGGSGGSFLPAWLIVVVVLLALAAITLGVMALRRRSAAPPPEPEPPGGGSGGPAGDAGA